ncbi:aminodeoxychorismate lyase [Peribacillus sp. SCS-155]|uniref:aminodeoxychorismate lyase n=1 Tax=Peribacillus sedimenti TaxID=3115297 RepID=UPI0039069795
MYLNGKIINEEDAYISPLDHGFLYGLGLFETFRIYEGHPFLLDEHLKRINVGLQELHIQFTCEKHHVLEILDELLVANDLHNARIRLNISAGVSELGIQTLKYTQPNIMVFMQPLQNSDLLQERKAVILKTPRNTPETQERLKTHHYLNNFSAKWELAGSQEHEGIFLTKEGFLAEGIVSNLFWVKGSTIFTPSIDTGILNGITRRFIISTAEALGFSLQEGFFTITDISESEEVFYTNSVQEIVAITEIESVAKYKGKAGQAVKAIFNQYKNSRKTLWSL